MAKHRSDEDIFRQQSTPPGHDNPDHAGMRSHRQRAASSVDNDWLGEIESQIRVQSRIKGVSRTDRQKNRAPKPPVEEAE